jgi:hypothetical protein
MKQKISVLLVLVISLTFAQTFAASGDTTTTADDTTLSADALPADDTGAAVTETWAETLNAASGKEINVAPKWGVGNYSEVACDKDFFTQNACNQCFEWGKKATWEKITWLTDSWTNPNVSEQIIYKDEQKFPEFVNLGGDKTTWINYPIEADKFWKYTDEIVWTDSATWSWKQEFLLEWGKTVNFLEWDLWASYALQSTDKKEWDPTGLLKFMVNYHDTDATANESAAKLHTECVVYYAWTPAPAAPVPVAPKEVTKVKTWPESYILIIVALLLSFGLLKYRKKA